MEIPVRTFQSKLLAAWPTQHDIVLLVTVKPVRILALRERALSPLHWFMELSGTLPQLFVGDDLLN